MPTKNSARKDIPKNSGSWTCPKCRRHFTRKNQRHACGTGKMPLSTNQLENKKNPKVDEYLSKVKQWQKETRKLRTILLACHLTEELKWGQPCYGCPTGNLVIIQGFKQYCALMFFKGVLMKDPKGILEKIGANSRVGRQIRFTSVQDIVDLESTLKKYIRESIRIEESGLKVKPNKTKLVFPEEFKKKLDKNRALREAFAALTPGRQRGYNIYFSSAKQSKTRESRIEKCIPKILKGKGLNDR